MASDGCQLEEAKCLGIECMTECSSSARLNVIGGFQTRSEPIVAEQPDFFARVATRRLGRVSGYQLSPELSAVLGPEVGRIVVDQLLELAEELIEADLSRGWKRAVDRAQLIDPEYTEQRWDAKELRRRG